MKPSKELLMKTKIIASLAVLMLAKSALAGGSSAGNGGNTIVCLDGNGQIKSVELLDFYEARVKRGITPDLGDDSLSVDEKVSLAISRLAAIDIPLGKYIMPGAVANFKKESVFLPGIRLVTVDDSDHLFVPAGCQQEQTALQKTPEFPGDKLFNIDQDLWNHMDSNNRAGLILHEVFYHLALNEGNPENSVPVRFFVSSISSAASISPSEFVVVLRSLKFPEVTLDGHYFLISEYEPAFDYQGRLVGGKLARPEQVSVQKSPIRVSAIKYAPTGAYANLELADSAYLKIGNQSLWFAANTVIFLNPDETISYGMAMPQNVEFKLNGVYDLHLTESLTAPTGISIYGSQVTYCGDCVGQVNVKGQLLDVTSYQGPFPDSLTVRLAHSSPFQFMGTQLSIQGKLIIFHNLVTEMTLAAPIHLPVGQVDIPFGEGTLGFGPTGLLIGGVLGEDAILISARDGSLVPYLKGMSLQFDEQGRVTGTFIPGQ
jgi:hypothetical protein